MSALSPAFEESFTVAANIGKGNIAAAMVFTQSQTSGFGKPQLDATIELAEKAGKPAPEMIIEQYNSGKSVAIIEKLEKSHPNNARTSAPTPRAPTKATNRDAGHGI